jgi:hypothetical protein
MPHAFKRVAYADLNARQQEAYNFQQVSAVLADYGFVTIRLTSDWQGADFIAQHKDGEFLKVQLKGRLTFHKKYGDRDLYVCFPHEGHWYMYPHDELLPRVLEETSVASTESWQVHGGYSFPGLSEKLRPLLAPYRLTV